MPIQTSYSYSMARPFKGTLTNLFATTLTVTGISAAEIEMGCGVVISATPAGGDRTGVALPSGASDVFYGVAKHRHLESNGTRTPLNQINGNENNVYEPNYPVPVLQQGFIYVEVEQAVSPADPVFLRHTNNGALTRGNFRKDADTARASQVPDASWASTTTGAGLAVLRLK